MEPSVFLQNRRAFLASAGKAASVACLLGVTRRFAHANPVDEDPPNTHNMLLVGAQTMFLSHLPMFDGITKDKTGYESPHRFQVILQATCSNGDTDASELYFKDRQSNPRVKMYTVNPEEFILSRMASSDPQHASVQSFKATIFRGHLERGGVPVPGLNGVNVRVQRVIHFEKFDPSATKPSDLQYLLFGAKNELYLAHLITKPPEFDQVISVRVDGSTFTDDELSHGVPITVPARRNTAPQRLKPRQQISTTLPAAASAAERKLQITGVTEFYFEEGELLLPPSFRTTIEEKKSGF